MNASRDELLELGEPAAARLQATEYLLIRLIQVMADRDGGLLEQLRREVLKGQIDLMLTDDSGAAALRMLRRAGLKV